MLELLLQPIDWIVAAWRARRQVRFTIHPASFVGSDVPMYFLNITNNSLERSIEITHVFFDTEPEVHLMRPERPLPKRLEPEESWETWIEEERIPLSARRAPFRLGRARLSNGTIVRSVEDRGVPTMGMVPGGPVESRVVGV